MRDSNPFSYRLSHIRKKIPYVKEQSGKG